MWIECKGSMGEFFKLMDILQNERTRSTEILRKQLVLLEQHSEKESEKKLHILDQESKRKLFFFEQESEKKLFLLERESALLDRRQLHLDEEHKQRSELAQRESNIRSSIASEIAMTSSYNEKPAKRRKINPGDVQFSGTLDWERFRSHH